MRKLLLPLLIIISSCASNATEKSDKKVTTETNVTTMDSYKTVVNFLKWYKTNYDVANNYQYKLTGRKDTVNNSIGNFYVNFDETEKYLQKIKSSNYISDKYLNKWRAYFKECQEDFNKDIHDLPSGFEYDFILITQDVWLDGINSPKLISENELENTANVKIDIGMRLEFNLSKIDGIWKIDNISNLGLEALDPDFGIALKFINDYTIFCNNTNKSISIDQWISQNSLLTDTFKKRYKDILDSALVDEPEVGLDFDPIFNGNDYPEKGFSILTSEKKTHFVTVNGIDWNEYKVTLKVIYQGKKWLVDGAGIVNIPIDKQARR